jgi:GNAT superfamily N-acetyltransferase
LTLIIRPFERQDALKIADLHLKYLHSRFPESRHSAKLLSLFYQSLSEVGDIALVSEVDGEVVGFICIVNSLKAIYLHQVRRYFLESLLCCLCLIPQSPRLFLLDSFGRFRHFFSGNERRNLSGYQLNGKLPELRPFVVRRDFQGTEVARSLVSSAERSLQARGVSRYFLRVDSQNVRALKFYEKIGFVTKGSEGDSSLVMEKILV